MVNCRLLKLQLLGVFIILFQWTAKAIDIDSLLIQKKLKAPVFIYTEHGDSSVSLVPYKNKNDFSSEFFIDPIDSNFWMQYTKDSSFSWNYFSSFFGKDGDIEFVTASLFSEMIKHYFPLLRVEWIHVINEEDYKGLYLRIWLDEFDLRDYTIEIMDFERLDHNEKMFWTTLQHWYQPDYSTLNWLVFSNKNGQRFCLPETPYFIFGGKFHTSIGNPQNEEMVTFLEELRKDSVETAGYDQNKMLWTQTMMYHKSLSVWSTNIIDFLNAEGKIHSKKWNISYSKFRRRIENHTKQINDLSLKIKDEIKAEYGEHIELENPRVESFQGLLTLNLVPLDSMRRPLQVIKGVAIDLSVLPNKGWLFKSWKHSRIHKDSLKSKVLQIVPGNLIELPQPEFKPVNVQSYRRIVNTEHGNYFTKLYNKSFYLVISLLGLMMLILSWVIFKSK